MPRPKTKDQLLTQSQENYNKLQSMIDGLDATQVHQEFPETFLNRNIRDVLAHIHHWHMMMTKWYRVGMAGENPQMPAEGHTWRTVPQLNREIQLKYENTSLGNVRQNLQTSYESLQKIINAHTNEELFTKKKYSWTGSTSLAAYLISATSSHYEWALKLIRKALKIKK